ALWEVKMPRIRVQATSEPRLVAPVQAAQAATQRPERSDGESGVGPAPSHSSSFLVTLLSRPEATATRATLRLIPTASQSVCCIPRERRSTKPARAAPRTTP